MLKEIKPGIYKHYEGKKYKVFFVANHSETLENLVIYEALEDCRTYGKGSMWARPLKMFQEDVIIKGIKKPRFKLVED